MYNDFSDQLSRNDCLDDMLNDSSNAFQQKHQPRPPSQNEDFLSSILLEQLQTQIYDKDKKQTSHVSQHQPHSEQIQSQANRTQNQPQAENSGNELFSKYYSKGTLFKKFYKMFGFEELSAQNLQGKESRKDKKSTKKMKTGEENGSISPDNYTPPTNLSEHQSIYAPSSNNTKSMDAFKQTELNDDESNMLNDQKQNKLQKNKVAARQSRQRKKVLFELMEQKIVNLQNQLNDAQAQLQNKDLLLKRISNHSKILEYYYRETDMFLDQLERFLNNQVDDNTNFNIQTLMDSMTVRICLESRNRQNTRNLYFNQFLQCAIPSYIRYVIYQVQNDLNEETSPAWVKEMFQKIKVTQENYTSFFKQKQVFHSYISNLENSMREFIEKKDNLIKTVTEFDRKLADFGESVKLDIKQSAMFFFYLYKNQQQKEIAPSSIWSFLKGSTEYDLVDQKVNEAESSKQSQPLIRTQLLIKNEK